MNILLIDNYDSFTYNLYQYLGEILQKHIPQFSLIVEKNDEITLREIQKAQFTHIILSPGPGDARRKADFGICSDVVATLGKTTPILGVCLGVRGIAAVFGGKITPAKQLMHGKISTIIHDKKKIFFQISQEIKVMRYHSWVVEKESLPESLIVTAVSEDTNEIMGLRHRQYPIQGVQFHPESFATEQGKVLLHNFLFRIE